MLLVCYAKGLACVRRLIVLGIIRLRRHLPYGFGSLSNNLSDKIFLMVIYWNCTKRLKHKLNQVVT